MSADKIVEMCLRFAGFDKDIIGEINVDEFMSQAAEYQQMVDESKEGAISKISINGQTQFKKGEWFAESLLSGLSISLTLGKKSLSNPLQSRPHYGEKQVHFWMNEDIATFCKRTETENAPHQQSGVQSKLAVSLLGFFAIKS